VDFTAEVERSLRVLDGAIAIFDAVRGVEPQTETVWRQAARYKVPCIGYVNKMDRVGANYFSVMEDIEKKFGAKVVPLQIPIGTENTFEGIIDLIEMNEIRWDASSDGEKMEFSPIRADRETQANEWREKLIDALSAVSDTVTEKYLAGEDLPAALIRQELRKAVVNRLVLPLFAGASRRNIGVQPLIDAVIDYLPAPDEAEPVVAHHLKKEEDLSVPCDSNAQPLGLVFKIQNEREAGSLCYVRMYSGVLKQGAIFNIGKKKRERVNRILRMHSNKSEPMDSLAAGDIGVIIGMKLAQTGDTIGSEGWPLILEKMQFPEPVISVSVEPKNLSEQDKLKEALALLSKEDPTFTSRDDEETGQLIISGMGELHLDVLVTRILKEYNVAARVGNPQVTYRESIGLSVERTESFSKVIAGKENAASLTLRVEPRERGSGNSYKWEVKDNAIPAEIREAVERGITASFQSGIVLGYPCIDIGVTVTGAVYSELSATEFAFEACASIGFDEACRNASPILLEPIMSVELVSPKEFVGDVISLMTQRGGQVLSMVSKSGGDEVNALAPMAKMFGFMTALRSASQGRAVFSMEFSHFEKKTAKS
jgi:elongation factor G